MREETKAEKQLITIKDYKNFKEVQNCKVLAKLKKIGPDESGWADKYSDGFLLVSNDMMGGNCYPFTLMKYLEEDQDENGAEVFLENAYDRLKKIMDESFNQFVLKGESILKAKYEDKILTQKECIKAYKDIPTEVTINLNQLKEIMSEAYYDGTEERYVGRIGNLEPESGGFSDLWDEDYYPQIKELL